MRNRIGPSYNLIYINALLIIIMCLIGNTANLMLSIIVLMICILFFYHPELLLPVVLISSLLQDYFVAASGIGMSRLFVIVYIVFSVLNLHRTGGAVTKKSFILLTCGILYFIISGFTSLTHQLKPSLTMVLNLLLAFFMRYQEVDDRELFIKNFKISIWVFISYVLLCVLTNKNVYYLYGRLMFRATNSNALGMCFTQCIIILITLLFIISDRVSRTINIVLSFLIFICLGMTGSRSAMLAAIISVVLLYLFDNSTVQTKNKLFVIVGLGFLGYVLVLLLRRFAPEIIYRFTVDDVVTTGGSNRFDIWKAVIENVIPQNIIFGVGIGGENTQTAMATYVPTALGVHNMYLTILAQLGLVGGIPLFTYFANSFIKTQKGQKIDSFMKIPEYMMIAAFINGFGEEVFTERFLWFAIGLASMTINNHNNGFWNNEEKNIVCN